MSKEKKETQMSWSEVFRANQCPSQEKEKEQMTTAISGQKCLDSLNRSNPNSLLGRMCKELLTSKTAWYSDRCKTIWKVKVSKSNVSLFQLQASVLGTRGTEFGLWATPNTMDHLPPRSKEGTLKLQQGHSGMRRGRRTIGKSGEDKVWRFYSEEEEQTRVDVRSKTIGRDAVSGKRNESEETIISNTDGIRFERDKQTKKTTSRRGTETSFESSSSDVLQSDDERREERNVSDQSKEQIVDNWGHDTDGQKQTWWQIESNICGVPNGISYGLDKNRANRIKTLGNAIVPQIAREIGLAIKKVLYDHTKI